MSGPRRVELPMDLAWRYASGDAMARLSAGLAEGRIQGQRCGGCGRRFLPPRPMCGDCGLRLTEWIDVADEGVLVAWTQVHVQLLDPRTGQPRPRPFGMGLIRLDGADTTLNHHLDVDDPALLRIGQRVRAVWREERVGAMDDIRHFEVLP